MANGGHIELEGLPNTRDLGGITTADGKRIRYGRLIRSGRLEHATKHDLEVLVNVYNLRMVIDLRTEEEREEAPDPKEALPNVRFENTALLNFSAAGVTREGGPLGTLRMVNTLRNNPAQIMKNVYASMIADKESQQGLARFFNLLLECDEGSVLWHCTIGKDRVGLATALLLHVLGVSNEIILQDYEATNIYLAGNTDDVTAQLSRYHLPHNMEKGVTIINSANPQYLQSAFDVVAENYGDLDTFLSEEIDITPEKKTRLRKLYLEDAR